MLIALAWLYFTDAAGISGMRSEQMDWDGDGTVTGGEIAQAFYAVSVRKNEDGPRTCKTYYWRRGGETIRVECKTTFAGDPE
ncbi:hypothetical protein CSC70_05835 [Pseudoxanthomonas kalamensis DSM 18571]|nr:hypothetical protein CSC70_05835 [Pseudoxanthomonas kalamensis DSM 18571]